MSEVPGQQASAASQHRLEVFTASSLGLTDPALCLSVALGGMHRARWFRGLDLNCSVVVPLHRLEGFSPMVL